MILRLIAVGTKMPTWVEQGYQDYAKRLPPGYTLKLIEIPAEKRTKQADTARLILRESEKIESAIDARNLLVALDVMGESWTTPQLATKLQRWHDESRNIDLVVGGPDGLSETLLKKANTRWSLSTLTLPHPIVRIVVAEQLYRAWSILQNHPYHRRANKCA